MKKVKICYSPAKDIIWERESEPMEVDLSAVEKHYLALGEKHLKPLEKFMDFWRQEGCERNFNPQARVIKMSREETEKTFGSDLLCHDEEVGDVVLAIWTLGADLEKESSRLMSTKGDLMTGFLMDVAGSIALYNIHETLMDWVEKNIAAKESSFIIREFYPGFDSVDQNMMEKVVNASDATKTIGVEARGSALLFPRKTQCSFVGLGTKKREKAVTAIPCNPCNGAKCLYYQLGGCHMQIMKNTHP